MATDAMTLLQKVDTTLAQIGVNGLLEPEEANKFIQLAIVEPVMLSSVYVTPMSAPRLQLPKSRFAGRVLRAGTEAAGLALAQRVAPDLSQIELVTVLYRAETRITDEVAEDQIEHGQFLNTVRTQLTEAIGRDLEHVGINGDVTTVVVDQETLLLSLQDGWLRRSGANLVAAAGATLNPDILRDMQLTLPAEFRADRKNLRYFTNDGTVIRYLDDIRDRATAEGDKALVGQGTKMYQGIGIVDVPLFPTTLGVTADRTNVLLTNPRNLVMGVHRAIKIEPDRDKHAGVVSLIASLRVAFHVVEDTATARADEVLA